MNEYDNVIENVIEIIDFYDEMYRIPNYVTTYRICDRIKQLKNIEDYENETYQ
jgi:hypothetical protein